MVSPNKKRETVKDKAHLNYNGAPNYSLSQLMTLYTVASSSFFGEPQYYNTKDCKPVKHRPAIAISDRELQRLQDTLNLIDPKFAEWRNLSPAQIMERAIDEALKVDPEWVMDFAVVLREEGNMRTTPQVILTRASHNPSVWGTGLVRQNAPYILRRMDEPTVALAYNLAAYGRRPIPNSLKKALRDRLTIARPYEVAKYRAEGKEVRLTDVASLVHPKNGAISKLMQDELRNTGKTWEAIISEKGSNKESWSEALEKMKDPKGHMALLRNLRNLLNAGIAPEEFVEYLKAGVIGGRQFPFRYMAAYKEINNYQVKQALEACIDTSVANLPQFPGRTLVMVDYSGSTRSTTTSSMGSMQICEIGGLTGVITAQASDDGVISVFGDKFEMVPIGKGSNTLRMLEYINKVGTRVGGGTDFTPTLRQIIRTGDYYDRIFIYSDMQAGHSQYGSYDVLDYLKQYRQQVNPNVYVYSVQIGGYTDNVFPEFYNKTYLLGGWSEKILDFAAHMEKTNDSVIKLIRDRAAAIRQSK